jgi:thiamine pyrophosphate-dependent acetolactate synthase large subunit-like protein
MPASTKAARGARSAGVGFTIEKPEQIRPAIQQALISGKSAIIEVVVDPFEPRHCAPSSYRTILYRSH